MTPTGNRSPYVYARETQADADTAKALTTDEARRKAAGYGRKGLATVIRTQHLLYRSVTRRRMLMRKIYVSDGGNDNNDGLTQKTPVRP